MTAGRPKQLTPELIEKAKEYLPKCVDSFEHVGDKVVRTVCLPKAEGLAKFLGVRRSTLYAWAKEDEEFSDIFEEVMTAQAEKLLDNGLSGNYNSTITKLILTKHGYRDEADVTTGGEKISGFNYIVPHDADTQTDNQATPGLPDTAG